MSNTDVVKKLVTTTVANLGTDTFRDVIEIELKKLNMETKVTYNGNTVVIYVREGYNDGNYDMKVISFELP